MSDNGMKGATIKGLREFFGVSQTRFGAEIGAGVMSVSNYEHNKQRPDRQTRRALEKLFELRAVIELAKRRGLWGNGGDNLFESWLDQGRRLEHCARKVLVLTFDPLLMEVRAAALGDALPILECQLGVQLFKGDEPPGEYVWTAHCPSCNETHKINAGPVAARFREIPNEGGHGKTRVPLPDNPQAVLGLTCFHGKLVRLVEKGA